MCDIDNILPGLYLGSNYYNWESLQERNITHILILSEDIQPNFIGKIKYMVVRIPDSNQANILSVIPRCISYIEEGIASGGILVHCLAGISRSPTIVMAYLLYKNYSPTVDEAYNLLRQKRSRILPNTGFWDQLYLFTALKFEIPQQKYLDNQPSIILL